MRATPILSLLSTLLLAVVASAGVSRDDLVAKDNNWRQGEDGLGAMLVLTGDAESFLRDWSRPAAPGYHPRIPVAHRAARGDRVTALVLFGDCTADPAGRCVGNVDYSVRRPDGSLYGESLGGTLWDEAEPPEGHLQVGVARLAFEIEPEDPVGDYRIEAVVRDLVSGRSVTLSRGLRVVETASER